MFILPRVLGSIFKNLMMITLLNDAHAQTGMPVHTGIYQIYNLGNILVLLALAYIDYRVIFG
jgi:hypothetical protein